MEPLDDLPGSLIFFVGVWSRKVEIEPVGVSRGRNPHLLAVPEGVGKAASAFAAGVGLPDPVTQGDPVTIPVLLDAGSADGADRSRALFGKRPEQQAARNLAGGVRDAREPQRLGLRPGGGDIGEDLGSRAP